MKKLISSLGLIGLLGLAGCGDNSEETKFREVKVSEYAGRDFGFRYCGMPTSNTFSIANGKQAAVNVYYSADAKEINFMGKQIHVVSVDAEQIKILDK